jgi:amino acid transporter
METPMNSSGGVGSDGDRTLWQVLKTFLIGKPRDLSDRSIYQHLSLVAFLAWVGLGADGLSSSCYGPAEAFHNLGSHTSLAVFLSLATIVTVLVISACYSHIIEEFPSGGGGYLVASKLLGRHFGLVSGCALLVDYVLTITVSIAAAGDALFGLLGTGWRLWHISADHWKLIVEAAAIVVLIILNLRGVKESVIALLPIFLLFLVTHAVLIVGAVVVNIGHTGDVVGGVVDEVRTSVNTPGFGFWGMLALLLHAYSLGAGTYTGIEAVSNSMPVMREPHVLTGKRTMRYMALSLSLTAGGLMLGYLLLGITSGGGKTMNHWLAESFVEELGGAGTGLGTAFVLATVLSEGALLFVAAQAGFIDGPRVLGSMARDSWVPNWFGNLSERLATQNGILLMGVSGLAALILTGGNVTTLVIMYSINVFVTFSLSMLGMSRHWWSQRAKNPLWRRRLALFATGATLCVLILVVTVSEKFSEGGWVTLVVTGVCIVLAMLTNRYYRRVFEKARRLDDMLGQLPSVGPPNLTKPDASQPTAAILVGGFGGLGTHTLLNAIRAVPGYFKNLVFVSVGVIDSGNFKGARAVDDLRRHTEETLAKYVELARRMGMPAASFMAVGTDAVDELEQLCREVSKKYPRVLFFAGQLVFQKDTWYQRLLHNETAFSLQRRLQWAGLPIMILPTRVR